MATATKSKGDSLVALLAAVLPEISGARYYGPCVVAAPGAWTRCGPTWRLASGDWVVVGPGIGVWGTTAGLAQLCREAPSGTAWHATAAAIVPAPQMVLPCGAGSGVLTAPGVSDLLQQATALNAGGAL